MDEQQLRQLAGQLRQPQGEAGVEVGRRMNVGNDLINSRAVERLAVRPGDRVLELGPGNGYLARRIVAVDPSVRYVGCDFSEVMVGQANQLNADLVAGGQVRFVLRTGSELPFSDASFDKLLTVNTLYFWPDPAVELAELRRVLAPGGLIVVGIRSRRVMEQMPFTAYGFTMYAPDEAADLLAQHGFRITELIVEPEPDQVFFGQSIRMETVLVCARVA